LEKVVRDMHEIRKMEVNGKGTLLAFADEIVILGGFQKEIEENTKKLIRSNKRMDINESKTKFMVMSRRPRIIHRRAVYI